MDEKEKALLILSVQKWFEARLYSPSKTCSFSAMLDTSRTRLLVDNEHYSRHIKLLTRGMEEIEESEYWGSCDAELPLLILRSGCGSKGCRKKGITSRETKNVNKESFRSRQSIG
jgi:hypothetical protein